MKRILVADDSVTIQKVIALTFADEPFEVQSVGTGSEALELVKSWEPDIILADVIMPQMNGYELCRAAKQQEESSRIPVLLLAGTFEAFDEDEAKSVGANGFITKPFESGELIEKVRSLLGDSPSAPPVEAAPPVAEVVVPDDPPAAPQVEAQPDQAPPAPAEEASEPDIWDILSESGDDAQATPADSGGQAAGFGPIEGTGVVDVGSFDVGIGRPESQPPPIQEPVVDVPDPVEIAPVPPVPDPAQDMDEKSRVENMEKDFFGFETGAVEEVSGTDILTDAVEEVTFEMEPPQAADEVDAQEVSFVVPEPAGDQAAVTGETISPDFMAPEAAPEPVAPSVEEAPSIPEVALDKEPPVEMTEAIPEPVTPPTPIEAPTDVLEAAAGDAEDIPGLESIPVEVPVPDSIEISGFTPDPVPAAEAPLEMKLEPDPEPPLELPVDLTPELPEEFSPEPVGQPEVDEPVAVPEVPAFDVPADPLPEMAAAAPVQEGTDVPDDEAIRKIVEEKVEKIVWEVVPEMAEVIIREAIQKIKDGS